MRVEPMIGDSWMAALLFNSVLGAVKAMTLEAHYSVDSIPYVHYPNPFLSLYSKDD